MSEEPACIVAQLLQKMEYGAVPDSLKCNVRAHHESLMTLATSLLRSGRTAEQTLGVLDIVTRSFAEELARTIHSIKDNKHAN